MASPSEGPSLPGVAVPLTRQARQTGAHTQPILTLPRPSRGRTLRGVFCLALIACQRLRCGAAARGPGEQHAAASHAPLPSHAPPGALASKRPTGRPHDNVRLLTRRRAGQECEPQLGALRVGPHRVTPLLRDRPHVAERPLGSAPRLEPCWRHWARWRRQNPALVHPPGRRPSSARRHPHPDGRHSVPGPDRVGWRRRCRESLRSWGASAPWLRTVLCGTLCAYAAVQRPRLWARH